MEYGLAKECEIVVLVLVDAVQSYLAVAHALHVYESGMEIDAKAWDTDQLVQLLLIFLLLQELASL